MYICVYRKVEDKLCYASKVKLPVVFQKKKKVKLCIYIWESKAWLRALESTYLRQLNYQKCCVTMPLWQSSNLVIILCHQSFLLHCLSYLLGAPSFFGEYFFPYDFKNIEHSITLLNSNAASREPLIIFAALMISLST